MNLNIDEYEGIDDLDLEDCEKKMMLIEWKYDINELKTEIKTQEMLVEFFKGEMFRLIRLCVENRINPEN